VKPEKKKGVWKCSEKGNGITTKKESWVTDLRKEKRRHPDRQRGMLGNGVESSPEGKKEKGYSISLKNLERSVVGKKKKGQNRQEDGEKKKGKKRHRVSYEAIIGAKEGRERESTEVEEPAYQGRTLPARKGGRRAFGDTGREKKRRKEERVHLLVQKTMFGCRRSRKTAKRKKEESAMRMETYIFRGRRISLSGEKTFDHGEKKIRDGGTKKKKERTNAAREEISSREKREAFLGKKSMLRERGKKEGEAPTRREESRNCVPGKERSPELLTQNRCGFDGQKGGDREGKETLFARSKTANRPPSEKSGPP